MKHLRGYLLAPCFLLTHALVAQNLIPDPTFSLGVGNWTVTGPATFQLDPVRSRNLGSGSAVFASTGSSAPAFATVCVPATGGSTYSWGHSFYFPSGPPLTAVFPGLVYFAGPGCTGASLGSSLQPAFIGSQRDIWNDFTEPNVVPPVGTASVSFSLQLLFAAAGSTVVVDNVYFGRVGTIPPFQDVTANAIVPSLSETALAGFALALAIVGLKVLRRT